MPRNSPCMSLGMKAAGVAHFDHVQYSLRIQERAFLLRPDGGIVDMPVSAQ